nr:MAG: hypothetical protein [Bacteriophage sp.]
MTRSEHVARSICVASESRRTGSREAIEVSTSHPASAIYPSASEASVAVFVVFFPISSAAFSSFFICSSFAPAIADVFAIAWLKSEYVLTASFTKSPTLTAAKAAVAIFAAVFAAFPIESSFLLTPPTLFSSEL